MIAGSNRGARRVLTWARIQADSCGLLCTLDAPSEPARHIPTHPSHNSYETQHAPLLRGACWVEEIHACNCLAQLARRIDNVLFAVRTRRANGLGVYISRILVLGIDSMRAFSR